MIRPYLRDLINEHKPIDESNDGSKENDDTDRAEWKTQLTKHFGRNSHHIHKK